METNLLGGLQLGFHTVLVLTGGIQKEALCLYPYRPEKIVDSIAELQVAGWTTLEPALG